MLASLRVRLRALLHAHAMERELDEELSYHLDAEIARLVADGMHPADAALTARRTFGNTTQLKEQVRDSWGRRWIERLAQDSRYSWRSFRRAPAFSATVVLTIALALGLNTTAFTIFNAYVLRPVAVRDPASLFQMYWIDRGGGGHGFTWSDYQALRAEHDAIDELFAFRFVFTRIDSTPAFGQLVSGNYFSMLGVSAALGRTLLASDAITPGTSPVIVLSHAAWRSRVGGDSSIVGRTIRVRGRAMQVVGVAAPGFGGLGEVPLDFWVPLTMNDILFAGDSLMASRTEALSLVSRLPSTVASGQAEAWLANWMRAHRPGARGRDAPAGAELMSRATGIALSPEFALFFAPIAAAFILVLLIACANVANMMLARGMARQRELGIRLSLGAARARLVGQLLTESVLLALPAAGLGFVISRLTIDFGVRLMFRTMSAEVVPYMRVVPLAPDGRVFAFMLAAALVAAVLFGLAPALQSTRLNVVQATRGDFDTDFRPSRLRNMLVVAQVTVCVLLLVCAGILLRNVGRMQHLDLGLRTTGVVRLDPREQAGERDRLLDLLATRSDVRGLAAATDPPFSRRFPTVPAGAAGGRIAPTSYDFVTASYFGLLEIPIVRGRTFTTDEERSNAPVVVVSDGTARAFWPGKDPIGQTLHLALDSTAAAQARFATRREARVIGVVPNVVLGTIIDPFDAPVAYFPASARASGMAILVRVSAPTAVTMRRIDAELSRFAPEAVEDIHTLDAYMAGGVYPFRAADWIAGALGAIALLLTITGVYGVLSYIVAQRRKELGIRVALGASASNVIGLVMGQSIRLAAFGLLLGAILALGVARVFAANIVRLDTYEPAAFAGAALLVLLSTLVAAYVPSRRAGTIDPLEAIRTE
jgi:predicted permease